MRVSEEQKSTNEDFHQIEIRDQRYDNELIENKIQTHIDNNPLDSLSKRRSSVFKYWKKNEYPINEQNKKEKNTIIDVLYENQRGVCFCGTFMFSQNSLLFFDPSPWTDKDFRYSPVNIFTATCPSPSWKWTWDKWKVDMYGNVDEEGWSYSFSFWSKKWYGTCTWFHSFVRRRKWVRERQWRDLDDPEIMDNDNYFTVSSSYRFSRSPTDTSSPNESVASISDNPDVELDIQNLIKKLKESLIDRERLYIIREFILSDNEKIYLLKDFIRNILECFIFQESKRQFLTFLIKTIKNIQNQTHIISNDLEELMDIAKKEMYKYDF
ncbi:hypothetical protein PORY_000465 [Pneumocystis oryctolagi]|uniref:Uncharacterized protein n=1 Tax=Pneumocystis oryctolagi TaxID=42067 RepID=A0ACB7CHR1_9ASCO|nr:hypothetical protein PORY_000465 [Pneumocystis oryctolagi]